MSDQEKEKEKLNVPVAPADLTHATGTPLPAETSS